MKFIALIFVIFCHSFVSQQEANCQLELHSNSYINSYSSSKAFFNSGLADEAIDPEFIDKELLEASAYFMLMNKRPRSSRKQMDFSNALQSGAEQLLSGVSSKRLKWSMRRRKTPKRHWKKLIKNELYKGSYLEMMSASIQIYDVPRGFKIRYDSKAEEGSRFYYMNGNKRKDAVLHTYESLVRMFFKNGYFSGWKALIRSKGLSEWGFAFRLDEGRSERSVRGLSIMVIGGGYRMAGLGAAWGHGS